MNKQLRRLAKRGEVPLLPGTPEGPLVPWVSPHPRAVVLTAQVHAPRSLRQLLRRTRWETTLDRDFEQVIAAATLESVFAFCAGCAIFAGLMRIGLVPERVCLECADIAARRA